MATLPAGSALRFDATGVVFVRDGKALTPRPYVILADDRVYLFGPNGSASSSFAPVPADAHAGISAQHTGRSLTFPGTLPSPDAEATSSPTPEDRGSQPVMLWVDPAKISLVYGGADTRDFLRNSDAVTPGDWDQPHAHSFQELDVHRALEDHLILKRPWEETDFYDRVVGAIRKGKRKWGCSSVEDFHERLEGLERLYEEIAVNGYKTQEELGTKRLADEIRVAIRRDGRFLFIDGRHRLSISLLVNLPLVPVRVVTRHPEWEAFKDRVAAYAVPRNGKIYQKIDHPDLAGFPAHHGEERIEIIRAGLEGYEARGKRLLDIGTHWGYMAQQMERLGFTVTAVEANRRCARFSEEIRVATESTFRVWEGSIFDFPDAENQDAVLALSIFHHFIKTPELHDQLTAFLKRLTIELMIFEPHVHDPPAQMKGAFRNYAPDEFAAYVAEHTGLKTIDLLGDAPDGRSIFRLTR